MLVAPPATSVTDTQPTGSLALSNVPPALNDGNISDSGSTGYFSGPEGAISQSRKHISQSQKFPHLRAQLSTIAREHRFRKLAPGAGGSLGSSSSGAESDADESGKWEEVRVSSSLVRDVAALLDEEKEDDLKDLLKTTFDIDEESVSVAFSLFFITYFDQFRPDYLPYTDRDACTRFDACS